MPDPDANAAGPTSHSFVSQRLRLNYLDWGNPDAPVLILSNHVSWLNICVITALAPVVFAPAALAKQRTTPPATMCAASNVFLFPGNRALLDRYISGS